MVSAFSPRATVQLLSLGGGCGRESHWFVVVCSFNLTDHIVSNKLAGHPLTLEGLSCRRLIWDRLSLLERALTSAGRTADAAVRRYGDHPRSAAALAHLADATVRRGCLSDAIAAVTGPCRQRIGVFSSVSYVLNAHSGR